MDWNSIATQNGTFRDPAGSVKLLPDRVLRTVYSPYDSQICEFLATPLATRLVKEGRLIASEIVSSGGNGGTLVLRHPRISFASYPAEWPPSLWFAAAELTLALCEDLLEQGWILKDATPLNVLFRGTDPVFVDVLSIERAELSRPIWYAYAQFVRTFLLPMLAHSSLGWPLHSVISRRDGFEPEDLYAALPWSRRFSRPALTSVTLPILLERRGVGSIGETKLRTNADPDLTKQVIRKTLSSLRLAMRKAMPSEQSSTWSTYVQTASHYSLEDHAIKKRFVVSALTDLAPNRVLDIGCNTGVYSRLAAEAHAEVVAIDGDCNTVDNLCKELLGKNLDVLPLCIDFAHPTPSTGWENGETASFVGRANGHFDAVLMLAVLHHLLLGSQIPLEHIASLCSRITTKSLVIEWVPPTDVKFIEVLRGRGWLYQHLSESSFRQAFAVYFDTVREVTLRNGRILLLLSKR